MPALPYDLEMAPSRVTRLVSELKAWSDEQHGRQSELARYLGISRQAINNWFGGRSGPTAEQALAIQEFLAKQKRKPRC